MEDSGTDVGVISVNVVALINGHFEVDTHTLPADKRSHSSSNCCYGFLLLPAHSEDMQRLCFPLFPISVTGTLHPFQRCGAVVFLCLFVPLSPQVRAFHLQDFRTFCGMANSGRKWESISDGHLVGVKYISGNDGVKGKVCWLERAKLSRQDPDDSRRNGP
jgi:hypothetical protein